MTGRTFRPDIYMPHNAGLTSVVRDPDSGALLSADVVTEGSAFIAAHILDQSDVVESASAIDLGCNEANWLLYMAEASKRINRLLGVDNSFYACLGAVANLQIEQPYLLDGVETRIWWQSWHEVLDGNETFDVVGFNPPYGTNRAAYRPEFQNAPPEAVLVPTGEKPDYYYSQVIPKIGRILNPGGIAVIRTPRAPCWRNQILRIIGSSFEQGSYATHRFIVHGAPVDRRTGRGFIVQKAIEGIKPPNYRYTAPLTCTNYRTPAGWQYVTEDWLLKRSLRQ